MTLEKIAIDHPKIEFILPIHPNPEIQKRYDAMSGSWEGVKASEAAAASSLYKPDFAPVSEK